MFETKITKNINTTHQSSITVRRFILMSELNQNLLASKKKWRLGIYDCLTYRDSKGKSSFCPEFFPKSLIW
jgi:hypothetical protein